ncbi:MAG TPA: phosphoribosyltransferase [Methanocella sp.]|nr:phosphoribosyltransferase [Methanocella sp.]
MVLPEYFKCVVTNWDYIYGLCRAVSRDVRRSGYSPDVIVALARGGWFAGRVLCDFLNLNDLTSLKIEHYTGTASPGEGPVVRYLFDGDSVKGKNVLIVDDITDTGKSLMAARDYIAGYGPTSIKTATLQHLCCSGFKPDYIGEVLEDWAWVVFPWNFMEDMCDLTGQVISKEKLRTYTINDIRSCLKKYHQIEPTYFEISQPGRLDEILGEMEYRGKVRSLGDNRWENLM